MKYVIFFSEAKEQDLELIGVKGMSVARLFKRGYDVPPGFILSSKVFESIVSNKEIRSRISHLERCPIGDIAGKAHELQKIINALEFPEEVSDEMIESYLSLSVDANMNAASLLETKDVYVAVRSSYVDEQPGFPGLRQKTILNTKGKDRLFKAILHCYAANFSPEAVNYRREHKLDIGRTAIIVQKMINAEKSGIGHTADTETGERDEIVIDAIFGLGEGISSGKIPSDRYIVDKKSLSVKKISVAEKGTEFVRDPETEETISKKLGERSSRQVLLDQEIQELARIIKKVSRELERELMIEWAIKRDKIYILQSKEIDVLPEEEGENIGLYENGDEKPEIIDISDQGIEEDISALEAIESIEAAEDEIPLRSSPEGYPGDDGEDEEEIELDIEIDGLKEDEEVEIDIMSSEDTSSDEDDGNFPEGHKTDDSESRYEEVMISIDDTEYEGDDENRNVAFPHKEDSEEIFGRIDEEDESIINLPGEGLEDKDEETQVFSLDDIPDADTDDTTEEVIESVMEKRAREIGEETSQNPGGEDISPGTSIEEEIVRPGPEDESIFSSYKDFDSFETVEKEPSAATKQGIDYTRMAELAKINAGNVVLYAHMLIKHKIEERLKKYVRDMPEELEKLVNELLEYESVSDEDKIRKLSKAKEGFISGQRYPDPDEVRIALELISK